MNRFDRIIAILIQLQSRKIVVAKDIAERFGISLRTVYRDIRTLEEAGVPILSEAGIGYSLMDGYRLPPVVFSNEEAMSLITAEKFIKKLTDSKTQKSFESALFKIKSVLSNADKELLTEIENSIEYTENKFLPENRNHQLNISEILKAIVNKKVIHLEYFAINNNELSHRDIEPVGIYASSEYWYLIAYCRLRKDYRNFRIDRFKSFQINSETFKTKHPDLKSFLIKEKQKENLHEIIIKVDKSAFKYFGDQHYYNGYIDMKEFPDQYEMRFITASLFGFARWFMIFGEAAEILKPLELKELVLKNIEQLSARLKKQ